jgi:hypothetical protein
MKVIFSSNGHLSSLEDIIVLTEPYCSLFCLQTAAHLKTPFHLRELLAPRRKLSYAVQKISQIAALLKIAIL